MTLETMYKGIAFSPTAVITVNISATDTMILVSDVDAFPDAPNIATIGVDAGAETIIYNDKTTSMLTGCVRGVEGIAKDWDEGVVIGRNFTAKDHSDMVDNIEALAEGKLDAEFKVEVTNSDEIAIAGKALDATQNNKDIQGTLANILENHSHADYTKTYKSLQEIDPSFTVNTPVKDVVLAMEDNSMAIYETSADSTGVYPTLLGTVIITKQNIDRNYVQCSNPDGDVWHTSYHVVSNPNCEWEKLLVVEDLQSRGVVETKTVLPQNADANTITENGIYQIWDSGTQEAVNFPIANPIGTLVVTNGGNFPVQTFTYYTGIMWFRSRGAGVDEWSTWHQVTTQKPKVEITSSMLKNGWGIYSSTWECSYQVSSENVTLSLMLTGGTLTHGTVILEGLPTISKNQIVKGVNKENVPVKVVYSTDGKLLIECMESSSIASATWYSISGTVIR